MTWVLVTPIPHTDIRRWLTEVAQLVTRALPRQSRTKSRRFEAHREAFIEDAAMAREMTRL
jgi:hypothetical protein